LDDVEPGRVGAEVMTEVPDLVTGAAPDLEDPLVGKVDLAMDVEQASAGTLGPLERGAARRNRDERMRQVLGVELLHQVDVERRRVRGRRTGAGNRPSG